MDHDSTRLTAEERRIFAEIETALRGDQRRSFRQRPGRASSWTRLMAASAVVAGTAVLAGGLWVGIVAVAGAGFVALLVGLSGLVADGVFGRMAGRVRRWFEHGARPGGSR
jgi:fatty acid desaturase